MNKIPMLEKFSAQSLVEHDGELIFSKEKFAELIVKECAKKTIQGLMSDPAFVQAMDEYYENKWAHRFD